MPSGNDDETRAVREIHPKKSGTDQVSSGGETRIIVTDREKGDSRTIVHGSGQHTILHRSGAPAPSGDEAEPPISRAPTPASASYEPVTGWLVTIAGPGRGKASPIFEGMNSVGRDQGQRIPLNFGDAEISREGHFFVTYEPKKRTFHLNHGTKTNLVYLNGEVVLGPMPLTEGDVIEVGKTKLRFVPLCGPEFSWDETL
jgi:FHA domain